MSPTWRHVSPIFVNFSLTASTGRLSQVALGLPPVKVHPSRPEQLYDPAWPWILATRIERLFVDFARYAKGAFVCL